MLLKRWQNGDRQASERLVQRHYHSVLRYFELNASWAANDLTQRTFMAAVERSVDILSGDSFRAYLMGIARRQLAMHQRELSRRSSQDAYEASDAQLQYTKLSTIVARSHEQLLVLRALTSLPRQPQLLLILYYWEGLRTPALAQHYGVTQSTVRSRLMRAREQLRTRIKRMGGSSPSVPTGDDTLRATFAAIAHAQALTTRADA